MSTKLRDRQIEIEEFLSKYQLMDRIIHEFESSEELMLFINSTGIPSDFVLSLLAQMHLHKRCDLPTLLGTLRSQCETAQEVANLIELCQKAGLVTWDNEYEIFIVVIEIPQEVQEALDRFQYPLPMIVEPEEVKNNSQSGYITTNKSIILKNNHHNGDVCLDHINRMNKIKLVINKDTVNMVHNEWRNMDKPKEGESKEDFKKRKRAFEKYDRTAHTVIDIVTEQADWFHLTNRFDKRGRTYSQGYHINIQGTAWNKAVVEFYDGEVTN